MRGGIVFCWINPGRGSASGRLSRTRGTTSGGSCTGRAFTPRTAPNGEQFGLSSSGSGSDQCGEATPRGSGDLRGDFAARASDRGIANDLRPRGDRVRREGGVPGGVRERPEHGLQSAPRRHGALRPPVDVTANAAVPWDARLRWFRHSTPLSRRAAYLPRTTSQPGRSVALRRGPSRSRPSRGARARRACPLLEAEQPRPEVPVTLEELPAGTSRFGAPTRAPSPSALSRQSPRARRPRRRPGLEDDLLEPSPWRCGLVGHQWSLRREDPGTPPRPAQSTVTVFRTTSMTRRRSSRTSFRTSALP